MSQRTQSLKMKKLLLIGCGGLLVTLVLLAFKDSITNAWSPLPPPQLPHGTGKIITVVRADTRSVTTLQPPAVFTWIPPQLPANIKEADDTDDQLVEHIRKHWIIPPSNEPRRLNNPSKQHYSQKGQSEYIDGLLKQKTGGFFIECGAADGESLSNSLYFEKNRNWTGLLIEANPKLFQNVLGKRRKAFMLNACLSPTKRASVLDFRLAGYIGGLINYMEPGHKRRVIQENGEELPVQIQCFPLVSVLRAINVTHVDYFSLDIEGAEYSILKNFPFDEIKVDVLTIEYVVSGEGKITTEKLKNITDLLIGKHGYAKTSYQGYEDIMLAKLQP